MDGAVISKRARSGWAKALEGHPFNTVDDLEAEIARGEAICISGPNSDIFARLERGVLELGPVHGDLHEMLEMLHHIEAQAAAAGASEVHVQAGREGWAPVLKRHGYEVAAVILRKAL